MLPKLRANVRKYQQEIVAMGGINYSDQYRDGDLRDSLNLSARRWPYLTTRRDRQQQTAYEGATAMTAWEKLVVVCGTNLYYDGEVVGSVMAGEKQFAVVNTKMVIWPDKVYLDMPTKTVKPLGASASGSGAKFTGNSITVTGTGWPEDLTALFHTGEGITISGCTAQEKNNKDVVIRGVSADQITVSDNTFAEGTESGGTQITIERRIPDMDFICESENRLWGCSSAAQTIYASSLGDPTNFFVYEGLSTDGYALGVGSDGAFTGCCKLASAVLFWKENRLHKLLGSYPAEYSLYTYEIEGLQEGCHKSLQVINEMLFYLGIHGVYTYSGGTPSLISSNFGAKVFTSATAGNDGDSYYLSAVEASGQKHMFVYETRAGLWVREDDTKAVDFARVGRSLYISDEDGKVWLVDGAETGKALPWMAQFTPFYETIQGRKRFSRLLVRLELPLGSWVIAESREDGGSWKACGQITGREHDVVSLRIPTNRCDKFELRLSGKGPCTILSVLREFSVGSER